MISKTWELQTLSVYNRFGHI